MKFLFLFFSPGCESACSTEKGGWRWRPGWANLLSWRFFLLLFLVWAAANLWHFSLLSLPAGFVTFELRFELVLRIYI